MEFLLFSMPGLFPYDYVKPNRTVAMLAKTAGALPPTNPFKVEKMPQEGIRLAEADRFLC